MDMVQVKYNWVWKIGVFQPISLFNSKMVHDTAMEDEWCHGAISSDLKWT